MRMRTATGIQRTRTMVERLADDFPLSWESVLEQAGAEATIGRPHIADALVTAGIVEDRSAAFAGLLSSHSKYYVSLPTISPIEAIRMVHEAGGTVCSVPTGSVGVTTTRVPLTSTTKTVVPAGIAPPPTVRPRGSA